MPSRKESEMAPMKKDEFWLLIWAAIAVLFFAFILVYLSAKGGTP
jgi:hypothetical protein